MRRENIHTHNYMFNSEDFSVVMEMMTWVLHWEGIEHLIHYLDDFLFLVPRIPQTRAQALSMALDVFARLCIPVPTQKMKGPLWLFTFLSICIDSGAGELGLPKDYSILRNWFGPRRKLEPEKS